MALTKEQEKRLLAVLVAMIIVIAGYRWASEEAPRTQPLTYTRGMKATSPVRHTVAAPGRAADPLLVFLERRIEKYPGVSRDLFRMGAANAAANRRPSLTTKPAATVTFPTSTIALKTPEETAAELARADLSKFRFLGYVTEKESTLFLSKDGELFIVKSGDMILKNYQVRSVGKDQVVLFDTITKVEVRVELTGSAK